MEWSRIIKMRKNIQKAPGVMGVNFEEFGYDGLSRMTLAKNDYSQVTQTYDSLSRLIQETQQIGVQPARTVQSGYDNMSNRTQLTYPSGKTIEKFLSLMKITR